jgi:hypothetical protein
VNVYVGVSYNRNAYRNTDSWWICVAYRDIDAPQPPAGTPPEYPVPIIVGELQKSASSKYPLVDVPIINANNSTWSVPTDLLFHPQPIPITNPPLPPSFDINIELFRAEIALKRLPWLPFIIYYLTFC